MKIAFIVHDRPHYRGGPIVNARRLLPELQRRGHEIHVFAFYHGDGAPNAEYLSQQGIRVYLQRFPKYTEDGIDWLLDRISDINPDVFVPNLSVAGWFAARWVRAAGIPTVAAHRSDDAFHWDMVEQFITGSREWAVSGLVCVSRLLCREISTSSDGSTRVAVIPSGVPVPDTVVDQYDEQCIGGLRIVYIGRLVQQQKRILDLIDAVAMALHHLPAASMTLIGRGNNSTDEEAVLERIRSHHMQDRIRVVGDLAPESVTLELMNHHVVVLLSDYEGTPGAVMDGMACGLVPVCLDIPGGVRELVRDGETGLLVKDRGDGFVAAITRLAGDPGLRERLGGKARDLIEQEFSLQVAADRWERFLGELVGASESRKAIVIPRVYRLPPVRAGLSREDRRRPTFFARIRRFVSSGSARFASTTSKLRWLGTKSSDAFVDPRPAVGALDNFLLRHRILGALKAQLPCLHGVLLDVGCGQMPYRSLLTTPPSRVSEYIGLDFVGTDRYGVQPDIEWADGHIPLQDASVDCALCTEVLEHCPNPEDVLREIYRVLRPGGIIFYTVPFLWPLHETPYDEYRYTPFALRRHLEAAGFSRVDLSALGGWDASLAQMLGLWVRRRAMSERRRALLSHLLRPLILALMQRDDSSTVRFCESSMITGLSGTAIKPIADIELKFDQPDR